MGEALMPRRGGGYKAHGFVEGYGDVLQFDSPAVVRNGYIRLVNPVPDTYDRYDSVITEVFFTGTGEPPTGPAINNSIDAVCRTNQIVGVEEYYHGDYYVFNNYSGGMFGYMDESGEQIIGWGVSLIYNGYAQFTGTYEYFIYE